MADSRNQILIGDCRETLRTLPAGLFHCAMTSPPYWGLRSYLPKGHADKALEIGSEPTPEAFIATMVEVFREVRRVLRDDGVLFVNLGDSYCDDSKWGGATGGKHVKRLHGEPIGRQRVDSGMKPGDLCNMPHRVAAALQSDGWFWRSTIIWHKKSPMPESMKGWQWKRCRIKVEPAVQATTGYESRDLVDDDPRKQQGPGGIGDPKNNAKWALCPGCKKCMPNGGYVLRKGRWRPTTGHEYLFMFSKCDLYFCDSDAVQEACASGPSDIKKMLQSRARIAGKHKHLDDQHSKASEKTNIGRKRSVGHPSGRNPRSVWTICSERYKGAHFAVFPTRLVKPCIEAATSKAGCCPACGQCWAPVVESERVATRPGLDSKILEAHANRTDIDPATNWQASTLNYGNRDPQRHVARSRVTGYRATCDCQEQVGTGQPNGEGGEAWTLGTPQPVPCLVLDPFGGSGTVAQVARALGRDWTICELSEAYADLARVRIQTPPRWTLAKANGKAPPKPMADQMLLFTEAASG